MAYIYLSPSQQEDNQYSGGGTGYYDSEEYWCTKVANQAAIYLRNDGHIVRVGNNGSAGGNVADANAWRGANCFYYALHTNAGGGHGTETWYYTGSSTGLSMATKLQATVAAESNYPDRGVKASTTFYELRATQAPAVLIEILFHDNVTEAAEMRADWGKFGLAVAKGIIAKLGGTIPGPTPTPTPTPVPTHKHGKVVNCSYVNVRSAASGGSSIRGTLKAGTICDIGGLSNGWRRVYTPINGWVYGRYIQAL